MHARHVSMGGVSSTLHQRTSSAREFSSDTRARFEPEPLSWHSGCTTTSPASPAGSTASTSARCHILSRPFRPVQRAYVTASFR